MSFSIIVLAMVMVRWRVVLQIRDANCEFAVWISRQLHDRFQAGLKWMSRCTLDELGRCTRQRACPLCMIVLRLELAESLPTILLKPVGLGDPSGPALCAALAVRIEP